MKVKVAIRKVETYNLPEVRAAVEDFLSAQKLPRLQNAKTVLVKPNLLAAFPPEKAVTTHPVVLEAIIQYLLENGKEVWLGKREVPAPLDEGDAWINQLGDSFKVINGEIVLLGRVAPPEKTW